MAAQLKHLVIGLSALAGVGLVLSAYGEVQRILDQLLQASQWTQQSDALTRRAQQVRQKIAESGADVALMRLTSEVRRTELPDPLHAESMLWQLGQLLQAHSSANLVNVAFAVTASPCSSTSAPNIPNLQRGGAPLVVVPGLRNQIEWKFQLTPVGDLSPRARQDVLVNVSRSVSNWSDWTVVNDPVRPAGTIALSSTQAGGANVWSW